MDNTKDMLASQTLNVPAMNDLQPQMDHECHLGLLLLLESVVHIFVFTLLLSLTLLPPALPSAHDSDLYSSTRKALTKSP